MVKPTPESVLASLRSLSANQEITILRLSEPITSTLAQVKSAQDDKDGAQEGGSGNGGQRTSDVSTSSLDAPTPSSLEADLAHYRELFAKLRFSYVEQVTKEKFIRAIVGDPPLIVTAQENADLEAQNAAAKAELKALKTEVADMVAQLEETARALSRRYDGIATATARLEELPAKIDELESQVAELKAAQGQNLNANPEMNLPLAKTLEVVEAKKRRRDELDRQLEQLMNQAPRKKKESERLQAELVPLEAKRQTSTAAAKEASRRKEAALGGVEDDLEERGRWFRAAEAGLKQMLEIEG